MGHGIRDPRDYFNWQLEEVAKRTRATANTVYTRRFGLDIDQLRILRVISMGQAETVGEIVELASLERTRVSRIISFLVRKGLISRQIASQDARIVVPLLTEDGRDLVIAANKAGDELEQTLLDLITTEEQEMMMKVLVKLSLWKTQ